MNELTALWLQMLILVSITAVIGRARQNWRWNVGIIAQSAIITLIALYGLFVGGGDTCAWAGWALYALTAVWPRILTRRLERRLGVFDVAGAREEAARVKLFLWGPPGRYAHDLAESMALTLDGQPDQARLLLSRYLGPETPPMYRTSALAHLQAVRVVAHDWAGAIAEFEALHPDDGSPVSPAIRDTVVRAYLEVGDVAHARAVLERSAEVDTHQRTPRGVQLIATAFYALSGASDELEALLMRMGLPGHAADAWRARCLAANGRIEEAQRKMAEAIAAVPEDQPRLRDRLEYQREHLATGPTPGLEPGTAEDVAAATRVFALETRTADLMAPARRPWAVLGVVAIALIAFIPAHAYALLPGNDRLLQLAEWIQANGQLDARALTGEWWRFVTYMFLHADIFHVGLNMLVLWMFGRQAEALFGPLGLLVIFGVTGVLGGAAQLTLAPDNPTIGASGAVLGVFGAVIGGLGRSRETLAPEVRKDQVKRLLSVAVFQMVLDQVFAGHIAVYVHAAGLIGGGLIGLIWPLKRR